MDIKKLTTSLLLAGAFALTSQAHAFSTGLGPILILDGIQIDGAQPTTFTFDKVNPSERAVEIKWDFLYEAGGDSGVSWGSELGFQITAPDGTSWSLGTEGESCTGCDFNFGFTNDPGVFASGGVLVLDGQFHGLGFWEITIFESFDDAGFDGQFLQGVIGINKVVVPVPAAFWLFGSGLMGLAAMRRRRNA